jgi:hypothetical protein
MGVGLRPPPMFLRKCKMAKDEKKELSNEEELKVVQERRRTTHQTKEIKK